MRAAGERRDESHAQRRDLRSRPPAVLFAFVLRGAATLEREGAAEESLSAGDAFVLPAETAHALHKVSRDLELLEARLV